MLDSTAQRQKAYLGHGKGLQNRRLPAHIATIVGDDYYDKRKSYDPTSLLKTPTSEVEGRSRSRTHDDYLSEEPPISPEEKEKQVRSLNTHAHTHTTYDIIMMSFEGCSLYHCLFIVMILPLYLFITRLDQPLILNHTK